MPDDADFRKEVQGKVQNLVAERHEKSTPELVIEAVVEGVKLYRSYKEEHVKEAKEKERRRRRHRRGGDMGDRHRHGHHGSRHGSKERENHRRRHGSKEREGGRRRRHGSRGRRRSRSCDEHRNRARENRHDRSKSQHRHSRSRSRSRKPIRDPVSESPPHKNDDEFVITGGAGPADIPHDGHLDGSLPAGPGDHSASPTKDRPKSPARDRPSSSTKDYQTSWRDLTSECRDRSRSRERKGGESSRRAPTPHRAAEKLEKERSRPESKSRQGDERRGRPPTPHHRGRKPSRDRLKSRDRSRSPHRHRRHRHKDPGPGRVGRAHSPTYHQKKGVGPDGTPFGQLPKYTAKAGLALGFGDHVMNTYKHIKAEHDAGHRSKGMLEKMLFEKGKKKVEAKAESGGRDKGKGRGRGLDRERKGDGGRGGNEKGSGGEWKPTTTEREAWKRHERRREGERDQPMKWEKGNHENRKDKTYEAGQREERRHSSRQDHQKPDQKDKRARRDDGKLHKRPPTPEIRIASPTPPDYSHYVPIPLAEVVPPRRPVPSSHGSPTPPPPAPDPPQWAVSAPPAPQQRGASSLREPDARSEADHSHTGAAAQYYADSPHRPMSGSRGKDERHEPPYPDIPPSPSQSRETSGASSPIQMPAPPSVPPISPLPLGPPPLPPAARRAVPLPTDLLVGIRDGAQLKKVESKDSSISPAAGKVVYDETAHSHDVEDQEREEEGLRNGGAWSAKTEASDVGGPKKAWRDSLLGELNARMMKGSRSSSMSDGVIVDVVHRTEENLDEDAPLRQMLKSDSGENLIFTLSAHIANPGWSFDGVDKK